MSHKRNSPEVAMKKPFLGLMFATLIVGLIISRLRNRVLPRTVLKSPTA
jgi:hypothetical protein